MRDGVLRFDDRSWQLRRNAGDGTAMHGAGHEFDWEVVNYAPLTVFGSLLLFGGWYVLSAKRWFKGPVREATNEQELAAIEAQLRA